MRVLIRTSKWAIWARRLGSFALPLAVIPVLMHRERLVASDTFHTVEAVAIGVACLALFLAAGAFARLWVTGDRGWGRATVGAFLALLVLLPVGYLGGLAVAYPPLTDISTDVADPPVLTAGLVTSPAGAGQAEAIAAAFPNVLTRTYPLGPEQIFEIAGTLVEARGWDIRLRRAPQSPLDEGQLNAIAMTFLGWRQEASIRIRGTASGSTVDMRSAALGAIHDLGADGNRIEEFLLALDGAVTVTLRDMPASTPASP